MFSVPWSSLDRWTNELRTSSLSACDSPWYDPANPGWDASPGRWWAMTASCERMVWMAVASCGSWDPWVATTALRRRSERWSRRALACWVCCRVAVGPRGGGGSFRVGATQSALAVDGRGRSSRAGAELLGCDAGGALRGLGPPNTFAARKGGGPSVSSAPLARADWVPSCGGAGEAGVRGGRLGMCVGWGGRGLGAGASPAGGAVLAGTPEVSLRNRRLGTPVLSGGGDAPVGAGSRGGSPPPPPPPCPSVGPPRVTRAPTEPAGACVAPEPGADRLGVFVLLPCVFAGADGTAVTSVGVPT